MVRTIPDHGELEIVDSRNMIGHIGFCTLVEVDIITKSLSCYIGLNIWFSQETVDGKFGTRLLSCL